MEDREKNQNARNIKGSKKKEREKKQHRNKKTRNPEKD